MDLAVVPCHDVQRKARIAMMPFIWNPGSAGNVDGAPFPVKHKPEA